MQEEFRAEDLRTGMKIITEDSEYIVLLNATDGYTGDKTMLVNPKPRSHSWTSSVGTVLREAIRIEIPEHIYDVFYEHNGWKVVWERETPKQRQIRELEETIRKAQEQIQALKEGV
jgi:hypothetical protein